jgi:RHS repeat-associated protein
MYDDKGSLTWEARLDIYGKVRIFAERSLSDCPFRYQGQYEDAETGLYYNRFRYYSPEEGICLSKDPTGLNGGMTLYGYVHDTNSWVDVFGLYPKAPLNLGGGFKGRVYAQQEDLELRGQKILKEINGKDLD